MNIQLQIDQSDMARLKRKLSDRRTKIGRILEPGADPMVNFFQYLGVRIEARARERVARDASDTGLLERSIIFRFTGRGAEVAVRARHGVFVHEGTRPHWPPPGALAGWARRHGVLEFLAARKISREGTKAVPFLRDAYTETIRRDVAPGIARMASAVESNWGRK